MLAKTSCVRSRWPRSTTKVLTCDSLQVRLPGVVWTSTRQSTVTETQRQFTCLVSWNWTTLTTDSFLPRGLDSTGRNWWGTSDWGWVRDTKIEHLLCPSSTVGTHPWTVVYFARNTIGYGTSAGWAAGQNSNYLSCAGYLGNAYAGVDPEGIWAGVFTNRSGFDYGDINDGSSNTFAFGESSFINWGGQDADILWNASARIVGNGTPARRLNFNSEHSGEAVNMSMCDGSVHFLNNDIDFSTYVYLAAKAEGRIVNVEDW